MDKNRKKKGLSYLSADKIATVFLHLGVQLVERTSKFLESSFLKFGLESWILFPVEGR